ncbi:HD domain-containing protein [Thermodesulfovibrio sp. 1176]|uniref:HD-GYP domain-containing protein n=2 Tax=unclassified Thermodesulfovibrio TaxID=2645936 RepID=UPI0024825125|nr:HD domain-containing phosphohydrolase [Thermodesulfovibrio sp. 1176]MDI1472472.1 HD domain-containing protein [Thermodesulfovibrio sp. 1176]
MPTRIKEITDYIDVELELLPAGIKIPFDIFIFEEGEIKQFLKKGEIFSFITKETLKEKNIDKVYIKTKDKKYFQDLIFEVNPKEYIDRLLDRYTIKNEFYFKIEKECLDPELPLNLNLYVYDGKNLKLIYQCNEKESFSIKNEIPDGDILIAKEDLHLYEDYLLNLAKKKINEPSIIKETTKLIIRQVYNEPTNRDKLLILADKIEEIINYSTLNPDILEKFFIMKKHDNYSYIHSINVMTLSISLGLKINITHEELRLLAMAGALHDIGKIKISPIILSKIGRMSDLEFNIYKNHVIESINIAKELDLPKKVIEGIAQHHEKLNGKGYPFKLKGEQISIFGKIISIVDAYDVLTTPQPLRYSLTPFNALQILVQDKGSYDKNFLEIFIKMIGRLI